MRRRNACPGAGPPSGRAAASSASPRRKTASVCCVIGVRKAIRESLDEGDTLRVVIKPV